MTTIPSSLWRSHILPGVMRRRAFSEIVAFIEAPERWSDQNNLEFAVLLDVFKYAAKRLHDRNQLADAASSIDLTSEYIDAIYSHAGRQGNIRLGGSSDRARRRGADALQKFFDVQFQSPHYVFMALRSYISKNVAHLDEIIPEAVRAVATLTRNHIAIL